MKKLFIICAITVTCAAPVIASTICAEDDVIAIVLDPTIAGMSSSYNTDLMEWGATFPYGAAWGVGACVDVAGTNAQIAPENFTDSNGDIVVGGERTGQYCWCQMRHPARSRWIFYNNYGTSAACNSQCIATYGCGAGIRAGEVNNARSAMFGSVGN